MSDTDSTTAGSLPDSLRHFRINKVTGCWLWTGRHNARGYGYVDFHGQLHLAHRAVYEAVNGELDHAIPIHHRCKNPRCVNPDHLEALPQHLHARESRRLVLVPDDVRLIRSLRDTTALSAGKIARQLKLPLGAVQGVYKGRTWRSLDADNTVECELV